MAVRPITIIGHKALHQPTRRVREVTDEVRELVADMFDTLEAADGAGLAANQVGVRLRIFVYECAAADEVVQRGVVINPVLEKGAVPPGEPDPGELEGCLSVPGEHFPTARSEWARVTGTDLDGNEVVVEAQGGTLARCLQHETDHLDGKLYVERLTPTYRTQARDAVKSRGWESARITKWDPQQLDADDV